MILFERIFFQLKHIGENGLNHLLIRLLRLDPEVSNDNLLFEKEFYLTDAALLYFLAALPLQSYQLVPVTLSYRNRPQLVIYQIVCVHNQL